MNFIVDTENHKVMTSLSPSPERHIIVYAPGSPMDYAIRVVEKLVKIHIRSERTGSVITSRTR